LGETLKKLILSLFFLLGNFKSLQAIDLAVEKILDLSHCEKSVYSPNGEDGIIAKIFQEIKPISKICVELTTDLKGSNISLLRLQNWRMFSFNSLFQIPDLDFYQESVSAENINSLFDKYLVPYQLDCLSITLDNNNFNIWEALDKKYTPTVVIIGYNALLGPTADFATSITAFYKLGRAKGYSLVLAEKTGANLFFIRDEVLKEKNLQVRYINQIEKIFRYPIYENTSPENIHTFPTEHLASSSELLFLKEKITKNLDLQKYLQLFPLEDYKIYDIPDLGKFYVNDLPDSIKCHLRRGIYWESGIGELVKKFSIPGSTVIDLGAHIGIHTITMSKKVGPLGLVIAFEPQFKIFRELIHNLKLNNCSQNVIALRNAVGDEQRLIEMSVCDPKNEGGTSIGSGGDSAYMVTLDSLNLNYVSFIKMDVESYELKVLQGAKETIKRNRPVIVFEILGNHDLDNCSDELRHQCEETVDFLRMLGYRIYRIHGNDFIAFFEE